jgi:hypothetical protein
MVIKNRIVEKIVNGIKTKVEEEVWKDGVPVMEKIIVKELIEVPPCKWLRIVVDYTGRPITALPFSITP